MSGLYCCMFIQEQICLSFLCIHIYQIVPFLNSYMLYDQDAQPRLIIPLWKANLEEPNFNLTDPAAIVSDIASSNFST